MTKIKKIKIVLPSPATSHILFDDDRKTRSFFWGNASAGFCYAEILPSVSLPGSYLLMVKGALTRHSGGGGTWRVGRGTFHCSSGLAHRPLGLLTYHLDPLPSPADFGIRFRADSRLFPNLHQAVVSIISPGVLHLGLVDDLGDYSKENVFDEVVEEITTEKITEKIDLPTDIDSEWDLF